MLVKEFIRDNPRQIITAESGTTVADAMEILLKNKISCLPIVGDDAELIGIISDKDIFREAHHNPSGFTQIAIGDLMSTELIVGVADDTFDYIGGVMTKNRIRHIPIVDNKQLIGLLSLGDIVKSQIQTMEYENRYLRQYIEDSYPG